MDRERHLIVWDGECGFCRRSAEWALARDTDGVFAAIPYQEMPELTPEQRAACAKAVHLRTRDGAWLKGGRACLFVLERVGYPRLARLTAHVPFVWVVELGYWLVAGNRSFFSRLSRRAA